MIYFNEIKMTKRTPALMGPIFIGIIFGMVGWIFWPTFQSLVDPSTGSDSLAQAAFVLIAFFVILWGSRTDLDKLPIQPFWWGIVVLLAVGLVWCLGELMQVRTVTYIAVASMIPIAVLTIMGYRWFWALSFPLCFLLLAAPVEGPFVPTLVNWTANFTFLALHATGIPVNREGAFFIVPTGAWSIADSCSGARYLSACLTLGVLYAWSMYHSFFKRLVFVVGAILIGIVGNWIRAYLTILIAHLSDNRLLRADHGSFGWWLFATLLVIYCWVGWRFRDTNLPTAQPQHLGAVAISNGLIATTSAMHGPNHAPTIQILLALALSTATLGGWSLASKNFAPPANAKNEFAHVINIEPQKGWSVVQGPSLNWSPELANPRYQYRQSFEKSGRRVDVYIGVFKNQTWNSKLLSSSNRWVSSENKGWSLVARDVADAQLSGQGLAVDTATIQGVGQRLLAWRWYWVDGHATANVIYAKLLQLGALLGSRGDTSAWIALYTPAGDGSTTDAAVVLTEFMHDMDSSLKKSLSMIATRDSESP